MRRTIRVHKNHSLKNERYLSRVWVCAPIVTFLFADFLRRQAVRSEVSAAVCYVPLIRAAIDFLRFELITCFTRETGLRWNPLRNPLILRKLPHGLADGFTEMCFPIENNYTGDCGAGINLEHTVSILNISKQP